LFLAKPAALVWKMHNLPIDVINNAGTRATATSFHMFTFIKNLFRETPHAQPVPKSSSPTVSEAEKSSPTSAPNTAPVRPPNSPQPCLQIPLAAIVEKLSPALASKVQRAPTRTDLAAVPLATIIEQLPMGSVRISFADLRKAAPHNLLLPGGEFDQTPEELPLAEVLSRIDPSLLARRREQKRMIVPDELSRVFVSRDSGDTVERRLQPVSKPHGVGRQDELSASRLMASSSLRPTDRFKESTREFPVVPARPSEGTRAEMAPSVSPTLRPSLQPVLASVPVGALSDADPVKVPLPALVQSWPEPLRAEVLRAHASDSINFPYRELEAALARGKASFTWGEIRQWLSPKPIKGPGAHDEVRVELPLATLIPLFLASRSNGSSNQRKVAVAEDLPNVFLLRKDGGADSAVARPTPSAARTPVLPKVHEVRPADPMVPGKPSIKMAAPVTATVASAVAAPAKAAPPEKPASSRSIPVPADLVERACRLSGVTGALIATNDGLVVANQLPAGMNAERLAAFLPIAFTRLGQYTRDLNLGEPTQLEIGLENLPLQMYRGAACYFAVLGKAADTLPKTQLSVLASQLSART
jgi:predicted regulator of Ras-like GTPase activity (Roadblock/LC7/MglB family)